MVASDGDLHAVGVLLLWADLADDRVVGDILTSVSRYFMVVDNEECIRSLDALSCDLRVISYLLAEAAHLIGLRRGPGGGVLGLLVELAILHELARIFIKYWQIHGTGAGCVCPDAVINGRIQSLWGWRRHGEDGA